MIVTCPNCETQFNLDDSIYAPGRKARCTVCQFMFILPALVQPAQNDENKVPLDLDELDTNVSANELDAILSEQGVKDSAESLPDELEDEAPSYSTAAPAKKKKSGFKRFLLFLALLLCLGGLGSGVYIIYFQGHIELPFKLPFELPFKLPFGPAGDDSADPVGKRIADIDKVKDLLLIDVSHKYVNNVKLGPLVVITGKVKNNFPTPKEMIRIEASLLDKKGKVLATQQQFCGIVVPDLQLQVLGQKELASALDNRFDMLANNINVQPGVEVPFMVVFVYPPSAMAEYTVVVADVADPPNMAPQEGQGVQGAQPAQPAKGAQSPQ